ncbi:hypothetical protein [Micromonospora ureilytica]|uniref:Uncharacterized protein n=1 Tax=Micromonospora ureilytica TaxID=709868 RepID=A0ABS0JR07_9ACTN|nr:hypothetical protein [Micromonospora ureilytica]MBG6069467.1 hypothetical protein [Micromonospora ureilytica]
MPQGLVDDLSGAAVAHWEAAERSGDPDIGWYILGDEIDRPRPSKGWLLDWLDRPWKIILRWRAFRAVPQALSFQALTLRQCLGPYRLLGASIGRIGC